MPKFRRGHLKLDCYAFTIAIGKPVYVEMAVALARSFLLHNDSTQIKFVIFSDRPSSIKPPDLEVVDWIEVAPGTYGSAFTPKLYLDKMAPGYRSLFIDADCIVVRSLKTVFDALRGYPVGVVGRRISEGEWFGDISRITSKLGIDGMPRFNGGIYYLERGQMCTDVYNTARKLRSDYDELGFVRLRGSENDEVLMSSALALHGVPSLVEDGTIMHTVMEAPGGVEIDTLSGKAILHNPKDHPNHFSWMPLERMEPAIVHFLGADPSDHPYRTEIRKLKLVARGRRAWVARSEAWLTSALPWLIARAARNGLRPVYHAVFGVRSVGRSVR